VLPTFLIIGAMKAGTTSLQAMLATHPQVFMSSPKELDYFVDRKNWSRGQNWYESHFVDATGAVAVGEASPSYTQAQLYKGVPERIASTVPDVRLIYLVREPLARAKSMYLHLLAGGRERRPAEEALRTGPMYLRTSLYAWQLEQYLQWFHREQILVLQTENLEAEPHAVLRKAFQFLGVDDEWVVPNPGERRGRSTDRRARSSLERRLRTLPGSAWARQLLPPSARVRLRHLTRRPVTAEEASISPELERWFRAQVQDDVLALRTHLGSDFDGWGLLSV
jgi:hypothetical protein